MLGDDAAYVEAIKVLQERYGNPFVISNAFRDKLDDWPKISPKDYLGLRRFGDFLHQCCTAARYVHHLHHLDDKRENKKLMSKLPEWLITRWGRNVVKLRQDRGSFPPFSVFTAFISDEADIACDPITSNQTSLKDRRQQSSNVRTLSTSVQGQQANGGKGKWKPLCTYCKGEHHLATCKSFMSQTLDHRTKFVFDHGLCFGCLRSGHLSKNCKKRSSCSTCKRRHPTVLHDENWTERQQSKRVEIKNEAEETQTTRSHASTMKDNHKSLKTSTIVPVSDTSFILDRTKEAMGIEGITVNLLLSTMTLANERISSEKISGLKVRAFNGREEICLPPTYTRNIMPANREHIPTPDIAKAHPHLNDIAKHLIPLQDCEIGLLIGYDCARALTPRTVLSSPNDGGPFGLQTDLGWSVVGTMEPNYHDNAHDHIGISHRIMVQVIPEELQIDGHPTTVTFRHQSRIKEEITPSQVIRLLEADFASEKRQRPYSRNDLRFLEIMEHQVHVSESGHYEMPLPFRDDNPTLPNNECPLQ
ncbi:uncharacterized protein LOC121419632 [Lytechinus variegatus]|uniref:uncharacterized protein LOC121419632 n=1 Tax=Lytechinus variegatus TaxID=7654 RepID=UPI001BB2BC14|nr:uncharacterized protein LOC121419632 [Lytechinus variegatus]